MINQKISIKNCNLADAKLLLNIHNSAVKKGYFTQTKIIRIKEQIKWVMRCIGPDSNMRMVCSRAVACWGD